MAFTKPTLQNLIDAVRADMFSRFPSLDASLPNSFAGSLSEVIAGGNYGLYGYLDFISRQVFPDTASDEYADRWGAILGLPRRAAERADGNATFTGTIGSSVTTGATLTSSAGVIYEVVTGFTLAATSELHEVRAVETGEAGNLDAAAVLTFVSVPAGIGSTATVDGSGLTGGLDLETDASYVTRILERFAAPPKGGAINDYIGWVKESSDATRVFVFDYVEPGLETIAAGQVLVYFAIDDADHAGGIPTSGEVSDVQDYLDTVRPLGMRPTAAAPVATAVDFTVSITPDTVATRAAVEAELADMIKTAGGIGSTIKLYDIYEAMSLVPALTDWDVTAPSASVTTTAGHIHTLGTVTFS